MHLRPYAEPEPVHPIRLTVAELLTGLTIYFWKQKNDFLIVTGVGAFHSWLVVSDRG